MGFLSNLFKGSDGEKDEKSTKKTSGRLIPYFPSVYSQDTKKSVVDKDKRYDLKRFSKHEADIIYQVLKTVDKKYPSNIRSMGLANEAYPITYKARYVLFDIIILRHENSQNSIDKLAIALAYESKGAFFREQAISYFEEAMKNIDKSMLNLFSSYSQMDIYLKFAELYEKNHDYAKAITYFKKARSSKGANKEYCSDRINKLEVKLKNPPRTRKTKKPDYYDEFERDVRRAAIAFITGNFSGIELNVRPNKLAYR